MRFNYRNIKTPGIHTNDVNVKLNGSQVNNDKYNLLRNRMLNFNLMDEYLYDKILSEDLEDIIIEEEF